MTPTSFVEFKPRPRQKEVLAYGKGLMGVAAVPGSGKTRTLSYLAAQLVADADLQDDQEILIVTLVNAAADHFSRQVGAFVKARGLLPNVGYRVRTLHSLANEIVRERPGLVGLDKDFKIIDEREQDAILQDAVDAWVRANPGAADVYLQPDFDERKAQYIARDKWPFEVKRIASAFIQQAKDTETAPEAIARHLDNRSQFLPLAEMCVRIYTNYQRALSYRGAVDFQDLIRLAVKALRTDEDFKLRLRHLWPFILEDEAQDSSRLQETVLELLAGKRGNWVRVGDPNQAIYETFTTARPERLRDFIAKGNVKARQLPNSGRSTASIMALANHLIDWTRADHPVAAVRERQPLAEPYILPTPPGDPQPNPVDDPSKIYLYAEDITPAEEIKAIVRSLQRWVPQNQDKTVAVLVPRNDRGAQLVRELKAVDLDVVELLRSSSTTRETAGALTYILEALSNPNAPTALANAFRVWRRDDRHVDEATSDRLEKIVKVIKGCKTVEDYLYPRAGQGWLDTEPVLQLTDMDESGDLIREYLLDFRTLMRRWQSAVVLPIDQLLLTVAGDLFVTAADLAIAHSLALYLRRLAGSNPHWRLPDFAVELRMVAQNKRRVVDLAADAESHDPDQHKGKVTVATMHAAKGLEWDRVYLASVNTYNFPSALDYDRFIGESWWVRDKLNLQAEGLEQLAAAIQERDYTEGTATQAARIDYAAERLRLLYVGITRARQELVITWNTGRDGNVYQAVPFVALQSWWEQAERTP